MLKLSKVKTDNSFFKEKVLLRKQYIENRELNILDCFHGKGKIWNELKKYNSKINIIGIEKEYKKADNDFCLYGDCLKFLKNYNMSEIDIIDLDCYGSPSKYIKELFKNKTIKNNTIVFYTNIYSIFGCQSKEVLESNGISLKMYYKCHEVFNKKRVVLFYNFLYNIGIRKINEININNHKFYGMFIINPE